jgi:hypothetical protein
VNTHDANGGHSDIWDYIAELSAQITELETRVKSLEAGTPQARRLQYEADVAMADAREYDD